MKKVLALFAGLALCLSAKAQNYADGADAFSLFVAGGAAVTASGTSATWTNTGIYQGKGAVVLSITNNAGTTPTFDCALQQSTDNGATWTTITNNGVQASFTQTTTGTATKVIGVDFSNVSTQLRTTNTLGGTTPSYTYTLSVVAPKKYK